MVTRKTPQQPQGSALDSLAGLAAQADALAIEAGERSKRQPPGTRQPGRFRSAPEDDLGQRIQENRKAKNLTQGDLADLTRSLDSEDKGISRAVLSLYESGTNRPSPREIRLLCEALTITPNYLIYGDDAPFHESNDYQRYGMLSRSEPEGYAWMAYVLASAHLSHAEAAMRLLVDLARGTNKKFDQGAQERANQLLLDMADELRKQR
ncbi:helix-turn-helix transcriptional regulator [Acidovorax sp. 99]|uniref:helix-turn-helix domain-containing protein n=1 Tax=Acidovorax sp. 99 TaxID=2135634 RepID=UPI000E3242A9|nr:helix-turn-helix transcriptional regulator [Acidovorax sp. 99]